VCEKEEGDHTGEWRGATLNAWGERRETGLCLGRGSYRRVSGKGIIQASGAGQH
jgi:hypothetical protein